MNTVITVTGPTASGKSALAVTIAQKIGGEVVSCDSMQIYRDMDIGTAKPTIREMQGIPHHLIGFLSPAESFSAAEYKTLCEKTVDGILARGGFPILCGGTGLYLDSVMNMGGYTENVTDEELRRTLSMQEADSLWAELFRRDPQSAEKIHKNNKKRVIRALEICMLSGRTKTEMDQLQRRSNDKYRFVSLTLSARNRDVLYRRIDDRVDEMMEKGLPEEVRRLFDEGYLTKGTTAAQAIGYKELLAWLRNEITLAQATEEIKRATRRYAKRQMTWFRRYPAFTTLYIDDYACSDDLAKAACALVQARLEAPPSATEQS